MNTQNLASRQSHQQPQSTFLRTAVATAVLAGAGLTSFSAVAASSQRPDASARAEIQQTYRAERAACTDGSSTQERGACLAEAAAARKEALAGLLGMQNVARNETARPGESDLLANALARCDAIPGDVRLDCERRIIGGEGVIVVGSVAEGAILRELAPAEPAVMVAQAETRLAPTEPVNTVVAEPTEPAMEPAPADSTQAVADAGLSEGETLVPADPAQATGLASEPAAETQGSTAAMSAAEATEASPGAATIQPGSETLSLAEGTAQPMSDMASHPALAPAESTRVEPLPAGEMAVMSEAEAAAEAQAQADAQRLEQAATPDAQVQPADASESEPPLQAQEVAPAARGADAVAYPEWMVPARFE